MGYCKLIDVCDFQGGSQPPKNEWISTSENGYVRMLQIRDFTQNYCNNEYVKLSNSIKLCNDDDILIARYGASVGKILTGLSGAYNVAIMKTVPDEKKLLKEYLYFFLKSDIFQNYIKNVGSRAAQAGFNKEDLNKIYINLHSIDEQKKIVKQLINLSLLIKNRRIQMDKYNQLIKSQFVEMFGCKQDGFKCNTVQFNECVSSMLKGPFGSDIKKSLYVPKSDDTYKVYIQVNAIQKNEHLGDYYISKEYYDNKMYKFEVNPLDYIVTCDGTLGKILRLDNDMEKGIISASLLKITLNEKISYKYFEEVWNQYMLNELSKDIRNACLTHLPSAKVIGTLDIPLPSKELQEKYTKIVEQIDKQKFELENSLKKLEELQASLMQEYFG